jgi:chromatin assembly factor 1 subunit A
MRLNAFFAKPKAGTEASANASVDTTHTAAPDPLLLTPDISMQDANPISVSPQKSIMQKAKNDYDRYFLPFQLPSHAIMAPYNRFMEDPVKLATAKSRLDQLLSQEDVLMEPIEHHSLKANFSAPIPRGLQIPAVVDIVERINGSSNNPIDLTHEDRQAPEDPLELLKQVPMKYLHFPEDVRPPYYGTYTKPHNAHEASKLARNPLSRTLHEADYDYDSELEWEEPEEGEDLGSEGGDDLDEEGDDDMEGFLDDEEDPQLKRRLLSGDLVPVSTGLCWEDSRGVSRLNDGSDAICTEFKEFRMGFLLGMVMSPISILII